MKRTAGVTSAGKKAPVRAQRTLTSLTSFSLVINGTPVLVEEVSPTTTLLEYLRAHGYTGTKCGCAEGDCGACTVALVDQDASGRPTYRAINSCIALLPMFAGREIVTVEGLASGETLHPVQAHMVEQYGSQCGYCTPGFVMSLFEAWYRQDCTSASQLSDQLSGNLCRCTGYRPIRDAALGALAQRDRENGKPDPFRARLGQAVNPLQALDYAANGGRFLRPTALEEVFSLLKDYPQARLVAGATEIGVDINKKFLSYPLLVSTEGVPELTADLAHGRGMAHRRGGHPDRDRGDRGPRVSCPGKNAAGVCLPGSQEPGHHGRKSGNGVPDRGQRAGPSHPGRRGGACFRGRPEKGSPG